MAAILGTLTTPIDDLCERASREAALVVAANYNTDEQTVVSGEIAGVERAMVLAKEAGAKRAVQLTVSGAFHSPLMAPAEPSLADAIAAAQFGDSNFQVYSNVTEQSVTSAGVAKDVLLRQLTTPVRWAGLDTQYGEDLSRCTIRGARAWERPLWSRVTPCAQRANGVVWHRGGR